MRISVTTSIQLVECPRLLMRFINVVHGKYFTGRAVTERSKLGLVSTRSLPGFLAYTRARAGPNFVVASHAPALGFVKETADINLGRGLGECNGRAGRCPGCMDHGAGRSRERACLLVKV